MRRLRTTAFPILLACLAGAVLGACAATPAERTPQTAVAGAPRAQGVERIIFVTRWDSRSADDIDRILAQARAAGFTDVFWQVRGQADAAYPSDLEPWAGHLASSTEGPGFDPFEHAIKTAHDQGLRIHAWINVLTLWHGRTPPNDRRHVKLAHPEWALSNAEGTPLVTRDGYELVNPARPEVRAFVASVAGDIATRYPIDGLCLDALRIPADISPSDPMTRRLFATENAEALGAGEDRAAVMERWLGQQVDLMVQGIASSAREAKPQLPISAVVVGSDAAAALAQRQSPQAWLDSKSVDRVFVLAPADSSKAITRIADAWRTALPSKTQIVTPAIMPAAALTPDAFADQLAAVGPREDGAIFSYAAVFETADPAIPRDVRSVATRAAKREVLMTRWGPKPSGVKGPEDLNQVRGVPQPPPKSAAANAKKKPPPEKDAQADSKERPEPEEAKPAEAPESGPAKGPDEPPDADQNKTPDKTSGPDKPDETPEEPR